GGTHPQRVLRPTDRLVRGHGYLDPAPYRGQLVQARAGLFDVFQIETVQCPHHLYRGVDVPGTVGVHPYLPGRSERFTYGFDAGQVLPRGLSFFCHLDLGRGASARGDDLGGPLRRDRGHGHVDRNPVAYGVGPSVAGRLAAGRPPAGRFFRPVLGEGGELPPAGGATNDHPLTNGDAPEAVAQADGEGTSLRGKVRPGVLERGHHGRRGNLSNSGRRFSLNASRPSCASSLM